MDKIEDSALAFEKAIMEVVEKYVEVCPPLVLAQALSNRSLDLAAYDARQYAAHMIETVVDQLAEAMAKRGVKPPSSE